MNEMLIGYQDGYMAKEGGADASIGLGVAGGTLAAETAANILPYVLLIPALMGAGAGTLHSKLTSPSKLDQETVQKALEAAELEEYQAELRRRRVDAERKEGDPGNRESRTLHL